MDGGDQGTVTLDPPNVESSGVGAWTQLDWRTFLETSRSLMSDLNGNLTLTLEVSGKYRLDSPDQYSGYSFYEGFDTTGNLQFSGFVTNVGKRIRMVPPPPEPKATP